MLGIEGNGTSVQTNFGASDFLFESGTLNLVRPPSVHQQALELTESSGNRHATQAAQLQSVESELLHLASVISLSEANPSSIWSDADQTEVRKLLDCFTPSR